MSDCATDLRPPLIELPTTNRQTRGQSDETKETIERQTDSQKDHCDHRQTDRDILIETAKAEIDRTQASIEKEIFRNNLRDCSKTDLG